MTDRVKESVFGIITEMVPDAVILDLFSGTGSLGIESLSRGAGGVTFVENSAQSIAILKNNLRITQFEKASKVVKMDAFDFIRQSTQRDLTFQIIFADPPYSKKYEAEVLELISKGDLLTPGGLLVIGHQLANNVSLKDDRLFLVREKHYGNTLVSIFGKEIK